MILMTKRRKAREVLGHKQRLTIPKKIKQSEKMAKGYDATGSSSSERRKFDLKEKKLKR